MSVVVVNCSAWAGFPSLVRTRALDLYRPDNRVEFWHAAPPEYESDLRIWGGWPKCFGGPLWILRDELDDLISSHMERVAATMAGDQVEPLALIVVFDAAALSPGKKAEPAMTVLRAMDAIAVRIANEPDDEATKVLRSLWRIALVRPGSRGSGRDSSAAEAWRLVTPRPRVRSFDQEHGAPGLLETFDSAVVLDGALRTSDDGVFSSLRVLIDMARDERVRQALKPGISKAEQRVIRLTAPRVRSNPSDRILINLDMLVEDREPSPERDEASDPLKQYVDELEEKTFQSDEHHLVEAAEVAVKKSESRPEQEYDSKIEETLQRYFAGPPAPARLTENASLDNIERALDDARLDLEGFLAGRHRKLQEMRRAQDHSMRIYETCFENVEVATTDRTFGQSGHMIGAIDSGLKRVKDLQQQYIERAGQCRQTLNVEYQFELAAARLARRDQPHLQDFREAVEFDRARTDLLYWFANSTPTVRFTLGWGAFVGFYAISMVLMLTMGRREYLSWSTLWLAISVSLPALASALWLLLRWNWVRMRRTQAITRSESTYAAAVDHINRVTRLALAHLASSRMAGRLKPFRRVLLYRLRDLQELRTATTRVFSSIRSDREKVAAEASNERATRESTLQSKLMSADPQDSLKVVLSEMPGAEPADVPIDFSGGEMTGGLAMRSGLVLDGPLTLSLIPQPQKPPAPPAPPPAMQDEPSIEAGRRDEPSPPDRSPDGDPVIDTASAARKPKRGKRSPN